MAKPVPEGHPIAPLLQETIRQELLFEDRLPNGKPLECAGCTLVQEPGIVPGEGPANAQIMIVGEAPGEEEAKLKRPFIGGSGRVLNRQLVQAGLSRNQCYVTNVVKCRPPKNRTPTDEEIRQCGVFLARELAAVRPNLVLCVGGTSFYALTGRSSISNHRGQALEVPMSYGTQKVFGTFHPAFVMRAQEMWPVAVHDLSRAKVEGTFPEVRRRPTQYHVDASLAEFGEYLERRARNYGLDYDLETTNLDPRTSQVICVGFAVDEDQAFNFRWTPQVAEFFKRLAADPGVAICGQNSEGFDTPFLEYKGFEFEGPAYDLMLEMHLWDSSQPKNLGYIMSLFTDMEYHKDEAKQNLFLYNAKDVLGARRSRLAVEKEIWDMGMRELYQTVMDLQPVLRRMQRRGLKMDPELEVKWSYTMTKMAREEEALLTQVFGPAFNPHSPKVLMDILYNRLGLPVQYTKDAKTKQMRPTANKEAIEKLAEISNDPILQKINKVRQLDHLRATYVEVEKDEQNFVHPRFGCAKAANGRLNSWDPNFQNIPVELRELYVPDTPEHVIIEADWSQIEWRDAMVLSGDATGLGLLASGVDNHRAVAAEGFGVPYAQVSDDLRHAAKFIVYGLGYGRGAADIARQLRRPKPWVEQFIARFFTRFRTYKLWRDDLERLVDQDACLVNPFARRRWWYTRQVTEMYNFPPSSTAADMMYKVLVQLERELPKDATLRVSVHDSVTIVAPKDTAREAYKAVVQIMQQPFPQIVEASRDSATVKRFYPQGWFCPVEAHIGQNWKEAKKGNKELEKLLGVV